MAACNLCLVASTGPCRPARHDTACHSRAHTCAREISAVAASSIRLCSGTQPVPPIQAALGGGGRAGSSSRVQQAACERGSAPHCPARRQACTASAAEAAEAAAAAGAASAACFSILLTMYRMHTLMLLRRVASVLGPSGTCPEGKAAAGLLWVRTASTGNCRPWPGSFASTQRQLLLPRAKCAVASPDTQFWLHNAMQSFAPASNTGTTVIRRSPAAAPRHPAAHRHAGGQSGWASSCAHQTPVGGQVGAGDALGWRFTSRRVGSHLPQQHRLARRAGGAATVRRKK